MFHFVSYWIISCLSLLLHGYFWPNLHVCWRWMRGVPRLTWFDNYWSQLHKFHIGFWELADIRLSVLSILCELKVLKNMYRSVDIFSPPFNFSAFCQRFIWTSSISSNCVQNTVACTDAALISDYFVMRCWGGNSAVWTLFMRQCCTVEQCSRTPASDTPSFTVMWGFCFAFLPSLM